MPPAQADPQDKVIRGVFSAFQRREDDFAVMLSLPDDPRFWLRLEKDSAPGTVVLTDFQPGQQDDHVMGRGLSMLLADIVAQGEHTVIFHNLVPGNHDPAQYRVELNRVTQAVQIWSEKAGRLIGKKVTDVQLDMDKGKARLKLRLS